MISSSDIRKVPHIRILDNNCLTFQIFILFLTFRFLLGPSTHHLSDKIVRQHKRSTRDGSLWWRGESRLCLHSRGPVSLCDDAYFTEFLPAHSPLVSNYISCIWVVSFHGRVHGLLPFWNHSNHCEIFWNIQHPFSAIFCNFLRVFSSFCVQYWKLN